MNTNFPAVTASQVYWSVLLSVFLNIWTLNTRRSVLYDIILKKQRVVGDWVFNRTKRFLDVRRSGEGEGAGVTWVKFCWVCAAGFSELLTHHSLFCGQILDPILVTLGKIGTLRNYEGDSNGNVQKAMGLKQQLCTCITVFCTFLCRPCITRTRNDQFLSLLGNGNGKEINSTISVRTQARSFSSAATQIPFF